MLITRKLLVVYGCSTYPMTALLSEMSTFCVRELNARYNWWVMAPKTHCSLFPISYLYVFTCITWELQVIYGRSAYWMTALLLETFLVCFRVTWEIQLERYNPSMHQSFSLSYNIVCIYCKPIHTSLFGVQLFTTTKLTYSTLWPHTTHQMTALLPNDASFYNNKVG